MPPIQFLVDWDFFGSQFERSFTRWPLAVTMGNHERDQLNEPNPTATFSGDECIPLYVHGGPCCTADVPLM